MYPRKKKKNNSGKLITHQNLKFVNWFMAWTEAAPPLLRYKMILRMKAPLPFLFLPQTLTAIIKQALTHQTPGRKHLNQLNKKHTYLNCGKGIHKNFFHLKTKNNTTTLLFSFFFVPLPSQENEFEQLGTDFFFHVQKLAKSFIRANEPKRQSL